MLESRVATCASPRQAGPRFLAVALLGAGVAAALAGCPSQSPPKKTGTAESAAEQRKLPAGFKLDLPTAPISARKGDAPAQYPDGSYSVSGLLSKRAALLDKEVTVTGVLVEVKLPPKKCDPCTPPHLFLADAQGAGAEAQRLLVADFTPEQVEELEVGKRVRLTGQFATTSSSNFTRTEGLLSFKKLP